MLQDAKTYYPFRISSWDDNTKCTMSSYFVSIRDESSYESADTSGKYGSSSCGLNQDDDFDLRQSVRAAQNDNDTDDLEMYRQHFDSISKDLLSAEQRRFDPEFGSFHQSLSSAILSMEQKWWSLFGKYWLVKK